MENWKIRIQARDMQGVEFNGENFKNWIGMKIFN
jgi:hypothetical protein